MRLAEAAKRNLVMALVLALALGTGCDARRTAEEQAAVEAQDACIAALEPVSQGRRPSAGAVDVAVRNAEAAAKVDRRWDALRARVLDFGGHTDSPESLDALVEECGRVNQIVKEKRDDVAPRASG